VNKIEALKQEKDGYDVLADVPRYAREGWEAIPAGDIERLKWAGIFFRRQTPGHFMMRLRLTAGVTTARQVRAIAGIGDDFGRGVVDLTTRQQIQLRWFRIDDVPEMWRRLEAVGLGSRQTGMDNVRGVMGCPASGLTPQELFDAAPVARAYTARVLDNKAYTNLPRKFNVAITACLENCLHTDSQDLALTPALAEAGGHVARGFNVAVGGKMGSGGYTPAVPLDVFVLPEDAAALLSEITLLFRDHGPRESRTRSRLAFLVADWGPKRLRDTLEDRLGRALPSAGRDARGETRTDHVGVFRQRQPGLNYVGLVVPTGRMSTAQLAGVADLAERYGNGEIRLTPAQNVIVCNVPDGRLGDLTQEPLLRELRYDPSEVMRGLVSCTGIDYCHFSLIETKERAIEVGRYLETRLPRMKPLSMHWSGCPNGCGNHGTADLGFLGKKVRVGKEVIEAVDVFIGRATGAGGDLPLKILEDVPCAELPRVLEHLVPYLVRRNGGR
jgi:ferredoxin-nitrite reductase